MPTDPDGLVRKLWRLRERLSSPLSSVPYEATGKVWSDTCVHCGSPGHFRAEGGIERCGRCGSQWEETEGRVPKGTSKKHRPRTNPMERAYFELARCVAVLNHVPEPARTLYEHHLSPLGGGEVYARSAARALGVAQDVSSHQFWTSIRMAREIVSLRLSFLMMRGAA